MAKIITRAAFERSYGSFEQVPDGAMFPGTFDNFVLVKIDTVDLRTRDHTNMLGIWLVFVVIVDNDSGVVQYRIAEKKLKLWFWI